MAMIECEECGGMISSNASSCPKCGNPTTFISGHDGGTEKAQKVRPGFWRDPNVGAVGCFVVVLIIILIAFVF
jgi:uncharacterized membrane protein YvbJ